MISPEVEYIVHGTVIRRQTVEMRKIPAPNNGGNFAERPETVVTVKVKEMLKGTVEAVTGGGGKASTGFKTVAPFPHSQVARIWISSK